MFVSPLQFAASSSSCPLVIAPSPSRSSFTVIPHDNNHSHAHSPLHGELIALGIVDANGDITEKAKRIWQPSALEPDQLARLESVIADSVYEKISLTSCLSFLERMYPGEIQDLRLIGGTALWVLGWRYYLKVLIQMGVDHPERYFPPHIQERFDQKSGDYDFRAFTTPRMAVSFPQVEQDLENMVKGKLRKSQLDWELCQRFNRPRNQSLYIQMKAYELVLYNKLGASFLDGHKAVEIPCKAALHEAPIFPESTGIHLLQALLDQLLMRLDPFPMLNEQGSIRQAVAITEGYGIWNQELHDKVGGRKFALPKEKGFGEYLSEKIGKINQGHPSKHPAADYFNLINALLLFGHQMTKTDYPKYWAGMATGASLVSAHPSLASLYPLWASENEFEHQLPPALITLSAFLQELFQFDTAVRSKLMYCGSNKVCSFQVEYKTNMGISLHLQTQMDPAQAYRQFVMLCVKCKNHSAIENFLRNLLGDAPVGVNPFSALIAGWKEVGIELRELRNNVISQLHQPSAAVKEMNFYLLLALHKMEPLRITENALLFYIPLIHELGIIRGTSLIEDCLGDTYAALYCRYVEARAAESAKNYIYAWITQLFQKMNSAKAVKLTVLLPRFQGYLPEDQYRNALERAIKATLENYPEQRLVLLENAFEKIVKLEPFHFALFCKAIFPYLNPELKGLLISHAERLGKILLRLCEARMEGIGSTTAREMVLHHLTDTLLNLSDEGNALEIGRKIVLQLDDSHPFMRIIGIHMHGLRKKAFPDGITPNLSPEVVARIKKIRMLIEKRNTEGAVSELIKLIAEEFSPSTKQVLEEEVVFLWNQLKEKVAQLNLFAFTSAVKLFHHAAVIKNYFYLCLEGHMLIMETMKTLYMKLKPQTLDAFLLHALQHFFSEIPKRVVVDYTKTVVLILSRAWAPKEPLSRETAALIKRHYPGIITNLNDNPEVQSTFMTQVYNCGISDGLTSNGSMIEIAERSLRDPTASPADQCTYLKIIRRGYLATHPKLSFHQLFLFVEKCFLLNQITTGQEWLEVLFSSIEKDGVAIDEEQTLQFQHVFRILHERGQYSLLMTNIHCYQKLSGNMGAVIGLFSDEAMIQTYEVVLQIFESLPLNSPERELYAKVLERNFICLKNSDITIEGFWLRCLSLLAGFPPISIYCWVLCCDKIRTGLSLPAKIKALNYILEAIDKKLIPEGIYRYGFWQQLIYEEPPLPKKVIAKLLARENLFWSIFYDSQTGQVSSELFDNFTYLLRPFCFEPDSQYATVIFEAFQRVLKYPTSRESADMITRLNQSVYSALGTQIPHPLYIKLFEHIKKILTSMTPQERENQAAKALTVDFFGMSSLNGQDVTEQQNMLLTLVNEYGNECWLSETLCLSLTYLNPEVVKVVKEVIIAALNKLLETRTQLTPEEEETFKNAFASIVVRGRFAAPSEILELIYSDPVKKILQKNHESLVIRFVQIVFQVVQTKDVPKGESVYESQLLILGEAISTFYPLQDRFSQAVRGEIFDDALELIINALFRTQFDKEREAFAHIFALCKYHTDREFYDNLEKVLEIMDMKMTKGANIDKYGLQAEILIFFLLHELQSFFLGLSQLIKIMDKFCFESNPHTNDERTILLKGCNKLMDTFETYAEANPNVSQFRSSDALCFRRRKFPYEYIQRLAQSRSVWSISLAAGQLTSDDYKNSSTQATNIAITVLNNLKTGSYYTLGNFEGITICCDQVREFITFLLKQNDNLIQYCIPKLLESYLIVVLKREGISPPFANLECISLIYQTLVCYFSMLYLAASKGLFCDETALYWQLCRRVIRFMTNIDPAGMAMGADFVRCGFYALSSNSMKVMGVDTVNSPDYHFVRKNIIDKFVSYFTFRHNSKAGLSELLTEKVESKFAKEPTWIEAVDQLRAAASGEAALGLTPTIDQVFTKTFSRAILP